jgi:hypothetical protein
MSRPVRWTAAALVVAAAACSDIATPIRNDFYEWRLVVPKASGVGEDSLTFHWPQSRIPVRIWVEDAASLPQNIPGAIAAWRAAFLYGEFDATVVSDSNAADVLIRAGSAPGVQFARARLHSALAAECAGATTWTSATITPSSGFRSGCTSTRARIPTRRASPSAWPSPPRTSSVMRWASGATPASRRT